jgi:hypothetical protein
VYAAGCPQAPPADAPPKTAPAEAAPVPSSPEADLQSRRTLVQEIITPIEDRTEALARNLDQVARYLRLGDETAVRAFFSESLEALLPGVDLPTPTALGMGLQESTWSDDEGALSTSISGDRIVWFLESLANESTLTEDIRIKVLTSNPATDGGLEGTLKMRIHGSVGPHGRLWTRVHVHFRARPNDPRGDHWKLTAWRVLRIHRMQADAPLFSEVSARAGVGMTTGSNPADSLGQRFEGAAVGDVNGDGLLDLVTVSPQRGHLYMQQGDGTFRDDAESAGISHPVQTRTSGVPLLVDYDNDGDPDLFIAGTGKFVLFENQTPPKRAPRFIDRTLESGVGVSAWTYSAAAGDVNGDGRLDLFATSYHNWPWVLPDSWARATNGTPNVLLIQQPDGTFRDDAAAWGVQGMRWSFAAQFGDLDGDADLDLFVANDYGSGSTMYRNTGSAFEDVGEKTGAWDRSGGMGVSLGDPDNDGDIDIHVTNMSSTAAQRIFGRLRPEQLSDVPYFRNLAAGNALLVNNGEGRWSNAAGKLGPFPAGWAWGGGFIDLDNDGWEDLHSPNGFMSGKTEHDT